MTNYFDKDGNPMSLEDWAKKHSDFDYKSIGDDRSEMWQVSTVWLGINHNFIGEGPPIIFESMVFRNDPEDWEDHDCRRYSTLAEAEAGHAELVKEWITDYNILKNPPATLHVGDNDPED